MASIAPTLWICALGQWMRVGAMLAIALETWGNHQNFPLDILSPFRYYLIVQIIVTSNDCYRQ
jgi:hypothetical protein